MRPGYLNRGAFFYVPDRYILYMCYPKPGPRCSSHAAYLLSETRRKALVLLENPSLKDETFEKVSKRLREAELEYSITPAGLEELKRYAQENPRNVTRYETALALRTVRLKALKENKGDASERNHRSLKDQFEYSNEELSTEGAIIGHIDLESDDITNAIEDSRIFSLKLTSEEQASLRRYSQGDYESINAVLANNPRSSEHDVNLVNEDIHNMDTALAKQPKREKPVIVYRRHFAYDENGNWVRNSLEEQQKLMPVGSIFEPETFLSTSLKADNLSETSHDPKNEIYRFEIKTYSAVSMSSIAAQGPNESEFLIPRQAKYRVISNNRKVTIRSTKNTKPSSYQVTVFQLEEILEEDNK